MAERVAWLNGVLSATAAHDAVDRTPNGVGDLCCAVEAGISRSLVISLSCRAVMSLAASRGLCSLGRSNSLLVLGGGSIWYEVVVEC